MFNFNIDFYDGRCESVIIWRGHVFKHYQLWAILRRIPGHELSDGRNMIEMNSALEILVKEKVIRVKKVRRREGMFKIKRGLRWEIFFHDLKLANFLVHGSAYGLRTISKKDLSFYKCLSKVYDNWV